MIKTWGAYDSISLGYFNLSKIHRAFGNYELAINSLHEFKEIHPWEDRVQYKYASAHETEIYLLTGNLRGLMIGWSFVALSLSDQIHFLDFLFYDVFAPGINSSRRIR